MMQEKRLGRLDEMIRRQEAEEAERKEIAVKFEASLKKDD